MNPAPPPPPGQRGANPPSREQHAPVPTRGAAVAKAVADGDSVPLGWAEEEETPRRPLSPLVLIGIALILMITVYIGATRLMNP
jgi:hypothetical protein